MMKFAANRRRKQKELPNKFCVLLILFLSLTVTLSIIFI